MMYVQHDFIQVSIFLLADRADSVCMYISKLLQNQTELRLHFRGRRTYHTRDCPYALAY
jgi:hypothetical protein